MQATSWNGVNWYHLSLREKIKNALLYVLLSQLGNVYQPWSVACVISRRMKVMHQCQKQVVMEWQWEIYFTFWFSYFVTYIKTAYLKENVTTYLKIFWGCIWINVWNQQLILLHSYVTAWKLRTINKKFLR